MITGSVQPDSRSRAILFLLFFYLVILSILFEMPILRRFLDIKAALWYNVRCMIIYFCTFRTALSPWKMRYTGLSAMR